MPTLDLPSLRKKHVVARPRVLVLLDPRGAFASVVQRPLWALMLFLAGAMSLVPPLTFLARADVAVVVQREMKRSGTLDEVPVAERDDVVARGAGAMKVLLPVFSGALRQGPILLLALIAYLVLRAGAPELTLATVVAVLSLGTAPLWLKDALMALVFATHDVTTLDAQNPVLSNAAAFLDDATARSAAGVFLRGVDFFAIWAACLQAIGLSVAARTRSTLPWVLAIGGTFIPVVIATLLAAARH